MKQIQRYSYGRRSFGLGAGVYSFLGSGVAFTLKQNMFMNKIYASAYARDAVTAQAIRIYGYAVLSVTTGPAERDDPIVDSAHKSLATMAIAGSRNNVIETSYNFSSNEAFSIIVNLNLETVTANAINVDVLVGFGYLCPEDYLSVDLID